MRTAERRDTVCWDLKAAGSCALSDLRMGPRGWVCEAGFTKVIGEVGDGGEGVR